MNVLASNVVENKAKSERILLLVLASYLNLGAWQKVGSFFLEDRFNFVEPDFFGFVSWPRYSLTSWSLRVF